MTPAELRGQGSEFAALLMRARGLRLPHAVLLEGPPGIGKSHAAKVLAMALLCRGADASGPCGGCAACRKVATGNHPDLHSLTVPDDKQLIPIEAVRAVQATLGLTAVEGRARVVVIDPADRLNEQGQNALLKTLEEPGDQVFLVLTARRPEALLATLRSRVQRYRLRPLPSRDLEQLCPVGQVDPERHRRAIARARGSVGLARELADPTGASLDGLLDALLAGTLTPFAAAAETLTGVEGRAGAEQRARAVLRRCAARCREALASSALAPAQGAAYPAPHEPWIAAAEAVFAAEEDLGVEISAQHALAELFLVWTEVLTGSGASRFAN